MRNFAENVCETSQTIGTNPYELDGSVLGHQGFAEAGFVDNDEPVYCVRNRQNNKYEYNRGAIFTESVVDTLARNPYLSTNANAAVVWVTNDLPLTIYIPTPGELLEAEVTMWLAAAKHALLRFGAWAKLDGISANIHQLNFWDGASSISYGQVDTVNHRHHLYGTSKRTRTQASTFRAIASGAGIIPIDTSIPQNNEGFAITDYDTTVVVESATSKIQLKVSLHITDDNEAEHITVACFVDSVANAVAANTVTNPAAGYIVSLPIDMEIAHPGIGSHTYKLRVSKGSTTTGSLSLNGISGATKFGGVQVSSLEIEERF